MVFVFFADTVSAKARQTSTITSIILASPCGDRETLQASSTYSMPHTAQRTSPIAGSSPIDVESSFRCISSARMAESSLNLWRTTFSTTAQKMLNISGDSTHPCRSPGSTPKSIRTDAVTRSHTSYHPMVELLDDCYHLRWYSDASEYLPKEGAVNGVVRLLEIYEAHEERHSCLPSNFLQPTNHNRHVRGRAIRSKPALLLR